MAIKGQLIREGSLEWKLMQKIAVNKENTKKFRKTTRMRETKRHH